MKHFLTQKQQIGKLGEDKACEFLVKKGFKIVERNYWQKWGEIDVIARKENDLRFVEVKTVSRPFDFAQGREGNDDYEPEDNLHPWKRKRLRRVIETYILSKDLDDEIDWQVDAITIYLNQTGSVLKIEQLEDIVL